MEQKRHQYKTDEELKAFKAKEKIRIRKYYENNPERRKQANQNWNDENRNDYQRWYRKNKAREEKDISKKLPSKLPKK